MPQHSQLWFDDGSVVLCAEDTLFRVHRSLLSRHSLCFRDMFALVKCPPDHDHLAGCPLVHLHDTAEDTANLLTALYDGPYVCFIAVSDAVMMPTRLVLVASQFGNNDQDDFRVVSGILRLATKYTIDSLRARALAHLTTAWPSSLKGWDAREDLARTHEIDTGSSRTRYPSPIDVINLAREVDAPCLLPSAFYDLSRYSFAQIYEPSAEDEPVLGAEHLLSPHDLQRLALGKEAAQAAITGIIRAMGSLRLAQTPQHHHQPSGSNSSNSALSHARKPSSSRMVCTSAAACRKEFAELVELATQHYLFDRERGWSDPLYVAEELGQLKSGGAELGECTSCAIQLEMWAARERERLWRLVPSWFRLAVS